jgi:hypothetical protein
MIVFAARLLSVNRTLFMIVRRMNKIYFETEAW